MKIEYSITKKRGNWRPVLQYKCIKEQWEVGLSVPGGSTSIWIEAAYPYVSRDERYVLPGNAERGKNKDWKAKPVEVKLPGSQQTEEKGEILLCWRPGAHPEYPEVHEAMRQLQAEWAGRVYEAMQSGEVAQSWLIMPSDEYRERTEGYAVAATLSRTK